jgi:hypothetical protein
MQDEAPTQPVERLFPLALKSRILIVGREKIRHSKSKLHFVLITRDISDNSREEMLKTFQHYPVVQHFLSADLEQFFGLKVAKVIGFAKSTLAQTIYAELKPHRLNKPVVKETPKKPSEAAETTKTEEPEG